MTSNFNEDKASKAYNKLRKKYRVLDGYKNHLIEWEIYTAWMAQDFGRYKLNPYQPYFLWKLLWWLLKNDGSNLKWIFTTIVAVIALLVKCR